MGSVALLKRNLYHPSFNRTFSIKTVLPALVADLTYYAIEVSNGGEAGLVWERMIHGNADPAERDRLRVALLAYCEQDTLAMAKILEALKVFSRKPWPQCP